MSRWDAYIENRVDEKVSKKEINTALKNDNIIIGCEFEFKLDDPLEGQGPNEEYENAVRELENYRADLATYHDELSDYRDETQELIDGIEEMEERIATLEEAIETNEEERDAAQTNLEEAESERDDAEDLQGEAIDAIQTAKEEGEDPSEFEADKLRAEAEIDRLNKLIDKYQEQIDSTDDFETEWTQELEQLERKKSSDEDDVKYREQDGEWEQVEAPYMSKQSMPDYFSWMMDYEGLSEDDLYVEPGEDTHYYPTEPDYSNGYDDIEEAVENSGIMSSAPFDKYEIGSYGTVDQPKGTKKWAVEDDSSVEGGLEVKSPPMELPKFMKDYLADMFDWINDIGYTDSDCGFHVHMSMDRVKSELDVLKLILFFDEDWIYGAFSERAGSSFATSVKEKLKTQGTLEQTDVKKLFDKKKLLIKLKMSQNKYDGINIVDTADGHIEFRYMGGNSYHRKYKDVVATIGVYAHNLSLAMDPEYKRKEYASKLQRIFNKMELYKLTMQEDILRNVYDDRDQMHHMDVKLVGKRLKETQQQIKQMSSVYKIDSRTRIALNSNRPFYDTAMKTIFTEVSKGLTKDTTDRMKRDFGAFK